MSTLPYYISWAKQKGADTFNIKSVDGVKVITDDGLELFDMTSISYQAHFGQNHPTIIKHMKAQLDSIPMSSPKGIYPGKNEATYELLQYMGKLEGKIFYTTGGAETVENALKIARDITKKKVILARKNSYHGATQGALVATGDWRHDSHQLPEDWVVRIPEPNDPDALKKTREIIEKVGGNNIAAIIIETITGGNGVYYGDQAWWDGLSALCKEFKMLLIMDEVVCGFGRTGKPFGYMHYNVHPDIICLAKGITGGMVPFGALWTSAAIAEHYEENILSCGLTNYAHPLGMAAMKGVLEIVKDQKFLENLTTVEKVFLDELEKIKTLKNVKAVRVKGMLAAVDLTSSVEGKKFFKKGLYLVSQTNRIILAPPLIINANELKTAMKAVFEVLQDAN
ncbi:MAG: aminotransferase class III-fold pyridoxal phosphate-dependent enzyme [Rhizobacter sp.]|nr:aminotransferase class III-fold pyridoxal phosphate-dependent enzyme [Bacteriovorax sp.]